MGKVIGIAMLVVAMWTGAEVYTKGTANAFGGLFVSLGWVEPASDPAAATTAGQRIGASLTGVHDESDARRERMLAE